MAAVTPWGALVLVQAVLTGGFALVATVAVWAQRKFPGRWHEGGSEGGNKRAAKVPVVFLRAMDGVDDRTFAHLQADTLAYDGPWTRILCMAKRDPRLATLPGVLLVESGLGDTVAKNRKMVHLQAGLDEAHRLGKLSPDTVVVHADADVVLAPGDVDQLVRTLRERGPHGAAFAAPWPTGGTPLSEHLAQLVLSGSLQSFAVLHALARITGGAPALSGKFVAWSAPTLQRMGGYRAFDHFIGDDVAMVDALHGQGFPVSLSPRAVVTEAPHRSVQVLQDQLKRWLQVASAHRPGLLVAYPTLVAPLPLTAFLALAAMVGGNHDDVQVALGATLAVLLCRLLLLGTLVAGPYRRAEVKRSPVGWRRWGRLPFALVAADALVLRAALAAAGRRDVLWQGRVYQLAQGGRIANCVRPGSYSTSNVSKLQA